MHGRYSISLHCLSLVLFLLLISVRPAESSPWESKPTWTEEKDEADVIALLEWVSASPIDAKRSAAIATRTPGTTQFRVIRIIKSSSDFASDKDEFEHQYHLNGNPGEFFVLFGSKSGDSDIRWRVRSISRSGFEYLAAIPAKTENISERLLYYCQNLEHTDESISFDAFDSLSRIPMEEIVTHRDKLSRHDLRAYVANPDINLARLGLYAALLGVCGNDDDAALLRKIALKDVDKFRLGADGVMTGFLLLTGESGLEELDKIKIHDSSIPFSETYAAMQALRFMWSYGTDQISRQRLKQSMRFLLPRPDLTDLVINDLRSWHDWEILDQILRFYDDPKHQSAITKRAIIRYLWAAQKHLPKTEKQKHAKIVAQLALIEQNDPKIMKQTKLFFVPH